MPLSQKQLEDVCLLYQGDHRMCRYLRDDGQKYNTYYCIKLRPKEGKKIDLRVNEFIRECRKKGEDPNVHNVPLGNNCSGYPVLKHIQQGYDQP